MLRMNKDNSDYEIDRELTWKFAIEKNAEYQDRIAELEEENKKLRELKCVPSNLKTTIRIDKENERLEEENKKLNIKVASLEWEIKWLNYTIEKLKEENQTLELWLDNKEKLNEEYRDKIDLLNYQSYWPSELADSLYDANKTIENLKAELSKYKKQYQHPMWFSDFWWYDE